MQRYSLVSDRTNQTVAIALAPDGGVIVGGYSATTNADLDYMVLKYAPGGQQLWLARYDSPTNGNDQLRGMVLDTNGAAIVTGTSKTIKLDGAATCSGPRRTVAGPWPPAGQMSMLPVSRRLTLRPPG